MDELPVFCVCVSGSPWSVQAAIGAFGFGFVRRAACDIYNLLGSYILYFCRIMFSRFFFGPLIFLG